MERTIAHIPDRRHDCSEMHGGRACPRPRYIAPIEHTPVRAGWREVLPPLVTLLICGFALVGWMFWAAAAHPEWLVRP
jgi:hypothetical protein